MKPSALAVYIATKNDTNGNPRRGWILFDAHGTTVGFVDEGYEGQGALRSVSSWDVRPTSWRIEVTPKEYAHWKKRGLKKNARKRTSRQPKRTSRQPRSYR